MDFICVFDSPEISSEKKSLIVTNNWTKRKFLRAHRYFKNYGTDLDSQKGNLEALKVFLSNKRDFLLNLLGNPNLLEHESFTDLLWAVFHLTEELACRSSVKDLSSPDAQHLSVDIHRAYSRLIVEWVRYMQHLKRDYPYLFSLAVRTNPFDAHASPVVK